MTTVTGKVGREIDDMDFREAVDLFEYWADCPPVHLLVRGYLGYEGTREPTPFEQMQVIQAISGHAGRSPKLSTAPPEVQERFRQLKEQAAKLKAERDGGR